jgi:choline-glycine betaine transporter
LQSASIAAGVPLSVILLFMMYGLVKTLHQDTAVPVVGQPETAAPAGDGGVVSPQQHAGRTGAE